MSEFARQPTVPELARRIAERPPYAGPSSVAIIRQARDGR